MQSSYRGNALVLLALATRVISSCVAGDSLADGEAIMSLRHGQPCFSIALDDATRNRRLLLYEISVYSRPGPAAAPGTQYWTLRLDRASGERLGAILGPGRCVEYGAIIASPLQAAAMPLETQVPYEVFLTVYSPDKPSSSDSVRYYRGAFCLMHDANERREKILVAASYDWNSGRLSCGD